MIHNDPPIVSDTPLQSNLITLIAKSDSKSKQKANQFRLNKSKKSVSEFFGYNEEQLQMAMARHLDGLSQNKAFKWFHVPNGGKRGILTAKKLKAQGVKRGVADVCIILPEQKVIWIELKTQSGTLGIDQKQFCNDITELGHKYYPIYCTHPVDVEQKTNLILRDNGVGI